MHWEFIVALVIAIPIILFPVAVIWYLNVGGIYTAVRERRKRRAACEQERNMAAATDRRAGQ